MLKVGLVINPFAGIGGPLALKGSDGEQVREQAMAAGIEQRALPRVERVLHNLLPFQSQLQFYSFDGDMGGSLLSDKGFAFESLGEPASSQTTANDTITLTQLLVKKSVDVILFAGGDGTARNIYDAVSKSQRPEQPVVGIPSGVKMHSGVYAITPESAAEVIKRMLSKNWVEFQACDVKDIDEDLFRQGQVRAKWYGTLWVPEVPQHMQQVKNSGAEQDELTKIAIADYIDDQVQDNELLILGPGSTTQVIKQKLNIDDTLLGVDVVVGREQIGKDVTAEQLLSFIQNHQGPLKLIITAIGQQGHILGRGNQQLSAAVLRLLPREAILVVATREKLASLNERSFLVDSNDPELDLQFQGFQKVLVGYGETLLYPVGNPR